MCSKFPVRLLRVPPQKMDYHIKLLSKCHFKRNRCTLEKEAEEGAAKSFPLRRHRFDKICFKSLTALSAKDSLENLQKLKRRNDGGPRRLFFGRNTNNSDKRAKKKLKKRFDKQNVSEVNIKRATDDDESDKLVDIVSSRNIGTLLDKDVAADNPKLSEQIVTKQTDDILHSLENLKLQGEDETNKNSMDCDSGDARPDNLSLELDLTGESLTDLACAQKRSVQWKREVDVIYYTGNSSAGKVVHRENEPLREEAEQQARRHRFIELALTKSLLSDVGACQLRDPWLVSVIPK
ncbi:uncharacterized protein LOC131665050 [Phymastichus coffea]|uniref:uncharacterized protein LOC131665050 n=1 Tax=Phymastichus coffea TaxID=108790 RepID=UPI00273CD740|nr:uncharacterized protein LOC131665050 [Phymastichus coffea]